MKRFDYPFIETKRFDKFRGALVIHNSWPFIVAKVEAFDHTPQREEARENYIHWVLTTKKEFAKANGYRVYAAAVGSLADFTRRCCPSYDAICNESLRAIAEQTVRQMSERSLDKFVDNVDC